MGDDRSDDAFSLEPVRRATTLRRLRDGPTSRSELQAALGVSKATLHRIVRRFADAGIVEETDEGVGLTGAGRATADAVDRYLDRMAAVRRLAPLLNGLPSDVDLDVALFADAEVVTPTPGHPQRPVQRIVDFIEEASSLRATAAVVLPIYVEVLHREVTGGMETELVVAPAVVEALREGYPDRFAEALDSGTLAVLVHDAIDVGLALADGRALVVGSEAGATRAAVVTEQPAAVDWAERRYASLRDEATPYDGSG